jgi:hypothetical protein
MNIVINTRHQTAVFSATFPKQADAIPLLEIPLSLEIIVGGRYRGDREVRPTQVNSN